MRIAKPIATGKAMPTTAKSARKKASLSGEPPVAKPEMTAPANRRIARTARYASHRICCRSSPLALRKRRNSETTETTARTRRAIPPMNSTGVVNQRRASTPVGFMILAWSVSTRPGRTIVASAPIADETMTARGTKRQREDWTRPVG